MSDREAVVRAVLFYKLREWREARTAPPCVMPELQPPQDQSGPSPPPARLERSWLPKPLTLCEGETLSYFSLTKPRVVKDMAFVEIDYHCGDCAWPAQPTR